MNTTSLFNFKILARGALLVWMLPTGEMTDLHAASPMHPELLIPIHAEPFDLSEVELLGGVFQNAMERNADWLLSLEPDRLLSWFRKEAGLEPKGDVYGGWESRRLAGQSLGHYLSALAMQYRATGDERFKTLADYVVSELALCQEQHGNGFVAAMPEGRRIFAEVARGDIRSEGFDLNGGWVPWYVMDKLFMGLTDAYVHTGNQQALQVVEALCEWAHETTKNLTDEQWQRMLACEFGGMNHSLGDIYAITGNPMHLELANKFYHRAILDPLAAGRDELEGRHANTQVPKIRGAARLHELTGREDYKNIATFFWDTVIQHHTYVNGGNSAEEHFGAPGRLSDRMSNTTETCNTYNMLRLTRLLFAWEPDGQLMDYYERALLNHILASQHPETGMVKYKGFLDSPARKNFSDPVDSWWCCVGTGLENHTKYGDTIYHHSGDAFYVNLFIASELEWREKGLTVRQETGFPLEEATRLTFTSSDPVELSLLIRSPTWCDGMTVSVNGALLKQEATKNGYVEIRRTFATGDVVTIALPMELRVEPMPDNPNRIAFFHGPVLLSADLAGDRNVPVLVSSQPDLMSAFKPVNGTPLHFELTGLARRFGEQADGKSSDLQFKPHYAITGEDYVTYLDVFNEQQWAEREAELKKERERLLAIEARTVGVVRIGEMQPERDFTFAGERTETGSHLGRNWRHAVDGGWFAYEMPVEPDGRVDLQVTYWGSDKGNRAFDIQVDGEVIATVKLTGQDPGNFFEVAYPIPVEFTQGKSSVKITFQAHPGHVAGGIFGCRILRSE